MTLQLDDETLAELSGKLTQRYAHLSAKGLSVSDRRSMQFHGAPSKSKLFIPEFAANDCQLHTVLIHAAKKYIYRGRPIPEDFEPDLDTVICKARHGKRHRNNYDHQPDAAGGYVAYIGAIAYRCWRLHQPSSLVARDMGVSTQSIRKVTQRLADYAEELGFPTYVHSKQRRPGPGTKGTVRIGLDRILALHNEGHSARKIAKIIGHNHDAVCRALKIGGVKILKRIDRAAIVQLLAQGMNADEVAQKTGCSPCSVRLLRRNIFSGSRRTRK